jgi:hypothetical protein
VPRTPCGAGVAYGSVAVKRCAAELPFHQSRMILPRLMPGNRKPSEILFVRVYNPGRGGFDHRGFAFGRGSSIISMPSETLGNPI